jgi:PPM family protein phosphatase
VTEPFFGIGMSADSTTLSVQPDGLDVGSATDVGRVRTNNEDALLVLRPPVHEGQLLVAVADGMGGHQAGEIASALAIETLARVLASPALVEPAAELLTRAVADGNRVIMAAAATDQAREGMGTTLVAALLDVEGRALIANVGDSRAYYVPGSPPASEPDARLITVDHTWVNEQVRGGQMSEAEARRSPMRHLLTRSLGAQPDVEIDLFDALPLAPGDALVLVSDGVSGYLDERDVATLLRAAPSAQAAADGLVGAAVARGGADNATAVVVRRRG